MKAVAQEHRFREITLPFILFTLIWSSTWIVIRDQLGVVPPFWSVTYRFFIAAIAMALLAKVQGLSLRLDRGGIRVAAIVGFCQFCVNFIAVYMAERHITSGLVATIFALLMVPNSLLAWAFLNQRPTARFFASAAVSVVGVALLFVHEINDNPASNDAILAGLALTFVGMVGAAAANVFQAHEQARRYPLTVILAWAMAIGVVIDGTIALVFSGPPVFDPRPQYWFGLFYLAIVASVIAFSLYFPVVRKIGPARAAYSSVLTPILAMALSTVFEGYRWTWLAAAGVALALGGMLLALGGRRIAGADPAP